MSLRHDEIILRVLFKRLWLLRLTFSRKVINCSRGWNFLPVIDCIKAIQLTSWKLAKHSRNWLAWSQGWEPHNKSGSIDRVLHGIASTLTRISKVRYRGGKGSCKECAGWFGSFEAERCNEGIAKLSGGGCHASSFGMLVVWLKLTVVLLVSRVV